MRNNVSNRVATEMLKFRKTPTLTLHNGRYTIVNLKKSDGLINFQYMPQDNTTTIFHILPCGGGIVTAKLRGADILPQVIYLVFIINFYYQRVKECTFFPPAGYKNPFFDPLVEKKSCTTREKHLFYPCHC